MNTQEIKVSRKEDNKWNDEEDAQLRHWQSVYGNRQAAIPHMHRELWSHRCCTGTLHTLYLSQRFVPALIYAPWVHLPMIPHNLIRQCAKAGGPSYASIYQAGQVSNALNAGDIK